MLILRPFQTRTNVTSVERMRRLQPKPQPAKRPDVVTLPPRTPDVEFYATTAPADYDGFGTETLAQLGTDQNGKTWRAVVIRDAAFEWQSGRNGSGLHATWTAEDWNEWKPEGLPAIAIGEAVSTETAENPPTSAGTYDGGRLEVVHVGSATSETSEPQPEPQPEAKPAPNPPSKGYDSNPAKWNDAQRWHYVCEHVDENKRRADGFGYGFGTDVEKGKLKPEGKSQLEFYCLQTWKANPANFQTASVSVCRADLLKAIRNAKRHSGKHKKTSIELGETVSVNAYGWTDSTNGGTSVLVQRLDGFRATGSIVVPVPVDKLVKLLTKCKPDSVTLSSKRWEALDVQTLNVEADGAQFSLKPDDAYQVERLATDFPATGAAKVSAGELLKALELASKASDQESTRYALGGVLVRAVNDSELDIVATDSRRLHFDRVDFEAVGEFQAENWEPVAPLSFAKNWATVIPSHVVRSVIDHLKTLDASESVALADALCETSRLPFSGNAEKFQTTPATKLVKDEHGKTWQVFQKTQFVIETTGASARFESVEGRFPRYDEVIPRAHNVEFRADRVALIQALESVSLMTDSDNYGIVMKIDNVNGMQLHWSNQDGETAMQSTVGTFAGSQPLDVTLNPVFLLEYLKSETGETATLRSQGDEFALRMHVHYESRGAVVMPLARNR